LRQRVAVFSSPIRTGRPLTQAVLTSNMKIFTIEEANALLPSVREILRKIQRSRRRLAAYRKQSKLAAEGAELGGGGITDGPLYAAILTNFTEEMAELEDLGVQLKDFERGLVDFPSLRDGRVVLLCWQLGEGDELEFWHDVDAGFGGRTPL
jgi:hypothetical protein